MRGGTWLVSGLVLLAACAGPTTPSRLGAGRRLFASVGGAEWDDTPVEQAEPEGPPLGVITAKQRESECLLAAREMWRVLEPIDAVVAEVELVYQANQGALTLMAWRRLAEGGERGGVVDGARFAWSMVSWLDSYVGDGPRTLRIVQHRERDGWVTRSLRADVVTTLAPEAKTLPVDAPDIPAGAFAALEREARRWLPLLQAPGEGTATVELKVDFEDVRPVGSSLLRQARMGSGALAGPPPGFETQVAGALVPFTEGFGKRSVRAVLETRRAPGAERPRWRVTSVTLWKPSGGEPQEPFTTFTEYRLLHEEVMRHWREDVRDTAVFTATFTAEQVALWVAGEWAAQRLGTALKLAAGPLARVLGRGGSEAVEWFYCLLKRIPESERVELAKLLAKVETEGFEALTATERAELRAMFQKLEQLAATPLTPGEKQKFWSIADHRFWHHLKEQNATLAKQLFAEGKHYPVHHKVPLEYAHLLIERDVNGLWNLASMGPRVHESIGKVWTSFRRVRTGATLEDVREVVSLIDRHYSRWYNVVYDELTEKAQLAAAEQAARAEVEAVIERVRLR